MSSTQPLDFQSHFAHVEDPRIQRRQLHRLTDILFLAVCATLAGADGPSDIEDFGKQKIDWLRRFIELPHGVPSHDTIGRVFALIQPASFQQAFLHWVQDFWPETLDDAKEEDGGGDDIHCIPIDGKTLRGSHRRKQGQNPLHLVSAWSAKNQVTLGQVAVDEKSNEITAIPDLLKRLELCGAIVSIDAMGCQKEIAKTIVQGQGDYVLALKDNQPKLAEAVETYFTQQHEQGFPDVACQQYEVEEKSRGRQVHRYYAAAPLPKSMRSFVKDWKGLRSIGQVITITQVDGRETIGVRYYIMSFAVDVKRFAQSVRSHWTVENSLHWTLDMTFAEDASRIHQGHAAENFSFLRKFAISLLKQDTSKGSMRGKRKRAAWSTDFLEKLLFSNDI